MKLTTTSYVVLALVERMQPTTAYDLKVFAHSSVLNFWALPHTVLYTETRRLADAGLLDAEEEQHGRRRRRFSLTDAGREALDAWRAQPADAFLEVRDPGMLQLFAGGDPKPLAAAQLERHQRQLDGYREQAAAMGEVNAEDPTATALRSVLTAGLAIEEAYVRFWRSVADDGRA